MASVARKSRLVTDSMFVGADGAAAAEGETPASASARRFDAVRKWKAGDKDGAKATASENAAAAAQKAREAKPQTQPSRTSLTLSPGTLPALRPF